MTKKVKCLLFGLICLLLLNGCSAPNNKILYTVYPVGYILERIGGNKINIQSLQDDTVVQRAQIVSNYEEVLDSAKLLLHIGNLEPYLLTYSEQIKESGIETIDLSVKSSIYLFKRYTRITVDDVEDYVVTNYYQSNVFDAVDVHERDLSLWIDPISMVSMAREIKTWLQETYPDNSDYFESNFEVLESELIGLDADYQTLASSLKKEDKAIKFVSMTPSFGNWQRTYGIQVYPLILSSYGVLPNDEQLAAIKERIQSDGVKYIAYEQNMTEDMINLFNQLEQELELTRVNLSNLSSLNETEKENKMDYMQIMRENLATLESMANLNNNYTEHDDYE